MAERSIAFSDDSDPQRSIFFGVRFILIGFDPPNEVQFRDALVNGGAVDAGRHDSTCTHVIVHRLTRDDPVCVVAWRDGKTVVTEMWVVDSLDIGRLADANHVLYMPVKDLNGIPEFRELHICLTGYQKQERYDIMRMVELLGAKFSKPLVATKVTHLVCYKFEGEKYDFAKKMGIKLVNHRWLEDSLRAWDKCPEDEYSKSSWELEFLDAEAGDSEEETENMGYGRTLYERENGGVASYMNGRHERIMKDVKTFEMQYNNDTVQVSTSTPNKILTNVHLLREGTPDKGAIDGRSSAEASKMVEIQNNNEEIQVSLSTPNKVLENVSWPLSSMQRKNTPDKGGGRASEGISGTQNFEASLVKENDQIVEHTVERTPIAENGEKGADYYDIVKVVSGTKMCSQTPYSDAFNKRTPPSCSSGTSKLSCASYLSKDLSNRLSFPHQSSFGERSILPPISNQTADDVDVFEVKTDALTMNQVHVMNVNGVASPGSNSHPGKEKQSPSFQLSKLLHTPIHYFEETQNKSAKLNSEGSEHGSSCNAAVDAHNILKNNLGSNTNKIQSVETAEDRMADPPSKKLLSFKRNSTKRQTSSSRSPHTLQAKVSGLHVDDQTTFSNKADAHMATVESHVTLGGGLLEMNSNMGGMNSLDSRSISNLANENALMSSRPLIPLNDQNEFKETDQKHKELSTGHNLSPEKIKTGESAEACENEMSVSSSKSPPINITKTFMARKYSKKMLGMSASAPFDAKCGLSSDEGVTTAKFTNGAEQALADAQCEALEGKKNFEMGFNLATGKVLQIDQENSRPSALRSSNKAKRKSAVMGGNDLIIDDNDKHSTEYKQPNTEDEVSDNGKNVLKFEQANEYNVFALKSAEGRENTEKFLGPNKKNCRSEVPKSSSKLKQKVRMVNGTNLDADKENRPIEIESQNLDNGKKHVTKKIVSKFTQTSKKFESQWFMLSGHLLQRKEFQQVIKNLRGRICRDSHHWCYQTTHLIVPDPLRRTEKFFAAAAAGRWILKTDYLAASSRAGKFLNEEPFEWYRTGLSEDGAINLEAPRKWRLLRQRTGHGAFYGMNVIIYGECIAPSLDTLKRVVKAGDGSILATSPPYHRFLKSGVDFAIVSPGMPRVDAWIQEFLAHNVPCILADYLVEFVCKPGFSLDRHVLYNTHAAADKSHANHLQRLVEVIEVPTQEDDILCSVCKLGDRAEVMLICGDDAGKVGCGVAMHIDCCEPPLDSVPEDDWFCSKCCTSVRKKGAKKGSALKRKSSLHVK